MTHNVALYIWRMHISGIYVFIYNHACQPFVRDIREILKMRTKTLQTFCATTYIGHDPNVLHLNNIITIIISTYDPQNRPQTRPSRYVHLIPALCTDTRPGLFPHIQNSGQIHPVYRPQARTPNCMQTPERTMLYIIYSRQPVLEDKCETPVDYTISICSHCCPKKACTIL